MSGFANLLPMFDGSTYIDRTTAATLCDVDALTFARDIEPRLTSLRKGRTVRFLRGDIEDLRLPPIEPMATWPRANGVYLVRADRFCKIGAALCIEDRLRAIQTGCPWALELVGYVPGGNLDTEQFLHTRFSSLWHRGEWYRWESPLTSFVRRLRVAAPELPYPGLPA